jgi:SAM-dependent methyltransferase
MSQTQASYDRVAAEYARRFADEMSRKPFDGKMLDWLAERVGDSGVICDMGCGPGQIAGYLKQRGADVCGIDLSPEMVREASRLYPDIPFSADDMLDLAGVGNDAFAGIAAFYSIIHVERPQVITALKTLNRVLKPGGWLLLTFHIGDETHHFDSLWEQPVDLDFNFFETASMKDLLRAAGFTVIEALERDPYPPDVEVATRRAYIFAQKHQA